ncbi:hypothetical protein ElP_63700 [Tautonia plasticadhaerens]|uniref:Uncharacterized protein n=1 Tax=Tautonia plasticadhaerens TaxID=2527974 RepID=A0A518HC36_9BACT|nr:hypothetical protein ElP_63700 [Tautonia plasticadhaerens]
MLFSYLQRYERTNVRLVILPWTFIFDCDKLESSE